MTSYTTNALNAHDFYPVQGEIRFVGTGETLGYPYLVCKKLLSNSTYFHIFFSDTTAPFIFLVCHESQSLIVFVPTILTVSLFCSCFPLSTFTEDTYKDTIIRKLLKDRTSLLEKGRGGGVWFPDIAMLPVQVKV